MDSSKGKDPARESTSSSPSVISSLSSSPSKNTNSKELKTSIDDIEIVIPRTPPSPITIDTLSYSVENYIDLAAKFAPRIYHHQREDCFPSAVEDFINISQLRYRDPKHGDVLVLANLSDLHSLTTAQHIDGKYGVAVTPTVKMHPFYLYPGPGDAPNSVGKRPDQHRVPVYVHIVERATVLDIQYWLFYPYNGNLNSCLWNCGVHQGDWEHITVRIRKDTPPTRRKSRKLKFSLGKHDDLSIPERTPNPSDIIADPVSGYRIDSIYISAHKDEGGWFQPKKFKFHGLHPIVYSSYHSHALYRKLGNIRRTAPILRKFLPFSSWMMCGLIDDHTGEKFAWDTWDSIEYLGSSGPTNQLTEYMTSRFPWLAYAGRWGLPAEGVKSNGPFGPAQKEEWYTVPSN